MAQYLIRMHTQGMKFNIRERRKGASLTQEEVADMLGISVSLYNGLETGKRRMNETYLEGLANIFEVPASHLIIEEIQSVPIASEVIDGAMVPPFDLQTGSSFPQVECPPQLSPKNLFAVRVSGNSMEPIYSNGDLLFFFYKRLGVVPSYALNKRCLCTDVSGQGWIKQVRTGTERGQYNLSALTPSSNNAHDVRLSWAQPVRLHLPYELAKITFNGDANVDLGPSPHGRSLFSGLPQPS